MAPTAPTVTCVSEWFIKPSHPPRADDLPQEPIHLTPFELVYLNLNYSQKGLLYSKPPPSQSQTENNNDGFSITAFLDGLRRSLSDTLTHFHPLAGRLATRKQSNPPSYVIYLDPAENSPGIKLVYATSSVTVCDILSPNDVTLFHPFFDLNHAINHDGHTLPLLSVQVTELVDGIFIGGSINHVVADGTSFWRFMNSWSQTYNNLIIKSSNTSSLNANGNASSQFIRTPIKGCDPMIINLPYTHHHQFIQRIPPPQVAVMERFFRLSSSSISKLKAKANAEAECQKISSLQAVSALVWRCITRARRLPQDAETVCKLATSNRHRLNPPLADDYFGNPVNLVRGTATVADLISKGLGWAALQLNEAIRKHDDTAVKEWIHSWSKSPSIVKLSGIFEQSNTTVTIGSSPRFDMYACEFGLGKPVATRSGCANKADGKITLFPGRDGPGSMGVEICLLPQYMMHLECDQDFISTTQI